jgi:hypothetical protein
MIKDARCLHVATLVEKTFYNCVSYFDERREEASTGILRNERLTKYAKKNFTIRVALQFYIM